MRLLYNKYRLKSIQDTMNNKRLQSSLVDSLKLVNIEFRTSGKLKDLPLPINKKRKLAVSILNKLTDTELKYSDSVLFNVNKDIIITWFKFNGMANLAMEVKCDHFLLHNKNSAGKKITSYFEDIDELLKAFLKEFNKIPEVA